MYLFVLDSQTIAQEDRVRMLHLARPCRPCLQASRVFGSVPRLARHCRIHSRASCTLGFTGAWPAGGDAPMPCAGCGASSSCAPVCAPTQRF